MYFRDETVPGACGVAAFCDFRTTQDRWDQLKPFDEEVIHPGGAGFICAGFIADNELSDKMFDMMSTKYDVLFVSPKRLNRNSQNQFYFAVFSNKDVENDKYGFDHESGEYAEDDDDL